MAYTYAHASHTGVAGDLLLATMSRDRSSPDVFF